MWSLTSTFLSHFFRSRGWVVSEATPQDIAAITIERKTEWPDWYPPAEMLQRQPDLPRFMAGGPGNPLGARAMYLSGTVYRIHGTNKPSSIGTRASSGCIRMLNADVTDLYERTHVGTKVVVLPLNNRDVAQLATGSPPSGSKPIQFSTQVWAERMPVIASRGKTRCASS